MHELSITQHILDTALTTAREHGATRVAAIDVLVGELSGIVDESVGFYFTILSRDTPAAGAILRFHHEPAELACRTCNSRAAAVPPLPATCPACGSCDLLLQGGRSLSIQSIDID